jgi:ribosomal protein S18 acetylase RimI-like enzyme
MTIRYTDSLEGIEPGHLDGFFAGWPNPPTADTHLRLLRGSYRVWLAQDEAAGQVVGFVQAVSDGVLTAFIPLLEVLPSYQHQGIASELVRRMLESLAHLYAIDLACDAELVPFYQRFSMVQGTAMLRRNYDRQNGGTP